jgi:hypothetical protein
MHLLAAWRDTRAYSAMVAMGHHPSEVLDPILGDAVTESYARCLASVCDGNIELLYSLFEDEGACYWARNAALDAVMIRVFEGDYSCDELIQYIKAKGESEALRLRKSETPREELEILDCIVSVASDIGAAEMSAQITGWFDDQLLDTVIADKWWVLRKISVPFEIHRDQRLAHGNGYVVDVEREIGWWSGFGETEKKQLAAPRSPVLAGKKIGRNDPCSCGSGKKYKKCCATIQF